MFEANNVVMFLGEITKYPYLGLGEVSWNTNKRNRWFRLGNDGTGKVWYVLLFHHVLLTLFELQKADKHFEYLRLLLQHFGLRLIRIRPRKVSS